MTLIIDLPDGYNGHTVPYFAKPIWQGKSIVWLQCAVPGKEHMRRWAHRETWEKALMSETTRYRAHPTTQDEFDHAVKEDLRREEDGREFNGHTFNPDKAMRDVDAEDLEVYLLAGNDLEHVDVYRRARRDWEYLKEEWEA